jgi:hypothetical protein
MESRSVNAQPDGTRIELPTFERGNEMALGVAIFLAGLIMVYLGVTNAKLGDVAREFTSGQTVTVRR